VYLYLMNNETQHNEKVASPETAGKDELLKITRDYPYFSLPWFYLLHDSENKNTEDLEKQRGKSSLFFSNTDWLNWQLYLLANPGRSIVDNIPAGHEEIIAENIASENKNTDAPIQLLSSQRNADESAVLEFQPLHTVDYFASQGIKITDEHDPGDKLAAQLKSFTEWIKSMKKIHVQKIEVEDSHADKKIQGIAEVSNVDIEVVTEAMAAVLIKQGKIEKAIEMYEKLSLNNPSKSVYFAAKIESLKSA
jgi:hypothetical protein